MAFVLLIPDPHESMEIRSRAAPAPSGRLKYGVSIGAVNCKVENSDNVFGNGFFGAFGTAPYHFAATTDGLMNTIGTEAPGEQHQRVGPCTTADRANATCSTTVSCRHRSRTPTTPPLVVSTNLPVRPLLLRLLQKRRHPSSSRSRMAPGSLLRGGVRHAELLSHP